MIEYLKSGEDLSKLGLIKERLLSSNYIVALTGAGMSIKSGVPDFITPKVGLYDSSSFITYSYPKIIQENPYRFSKFYRECLIELHRIKPNSGHEVLSKWEKRGRRSTGVIIINNKTALGDKCADILINGRNIGETLVETHRQIENSF